MSITSGLTVAPILALGGRHPSVFIGVTLAGPPTGVAAATHSRAACFEAPAPRGSGISASSRWRLGCSRPCWAASSVSRWSLSST